MIGHAPGIGPGSLSVAVTIDRDAGGAGRVCDVNVGSSRPVGFSSALFIGRPGDEIPALVGRLHALCGLSHATASAVALAAARDEDIAAVAADHYEGLIAERIGEHLRSVFTGPTGTPAGEVARDTLADLRAALAAARNLIDGTVRPLGEVPHAAAVDQIRRSVARLGLALDSHHRLRMSPNSWAFAVSERAGSATGDEFLAADPLETGDDDAVIAALAADPLGYAAAPSLPGRRPETGPFARAVVRNGGGVFDGRGRIEARLAEIADAARLLALPRPIREESIATWIRGQSLEVNTGYAAVESPRGRLHHLVRVDDAGRITAYAILAPTEWNFGPAGPFVATLRANRVAPGPAGLARVERIAATFDPCVGFDVTVEERTHA